MAIEQRSKKAMNSDLTSPDLILIMGEASRPLHSRSGFIIHSWTCSRCGFSYCGCWR